MTQTTIADLTSERASLHTTVMLALLARLAVGIRRANQSTFQTYRIKP